MNRGPQYVPFHVVNRDGVTVPAKYIKVKMTNDPYAYGMLNSTGKVYKGLIHAALYSTLRTYPALAPKISHHFTLIMRTRRASTTPWPV